MFDYDVIHLLITRPARQFSADFLKSSQTKVGKITKTKKKETTFDMGLKFKMLQQSESLVQSVEQLNSYFNGRGFEPRQGRFKKNCSFLMILNNASKQLLDNCESFIVTSLKDSNKINC